jgi:hypothetical protein
MRNALPKMAKDLLNTSFIPFALVPTRHTLLRQYCLGIIALARRIAPSCLTEKELTYLSPPFSHLPSSFEDPPKATEEQIKKVKEAAISMDFGNYTFGRLIPKRSNYDDNHPDYIATSRAIMDRMISLGYDPDRFQPIDQNLRSHSRLGQENRKVDRYGKKFGWIAYFEMWGWRSDNNLLPDWRSDQRSSDADIDLTFPVKEKSWIPTLPELFTGSPNKIADWILEGPTPDYSSLLQISDVDKVAGNWVLLDGFIVETAQTDHRQIFTFLRGVFVHKVNVEQLLKTFESMEYPGNDLIPRPPERHYIYAGEMTFEDPPGLPGLAHSEKESDEISYKISKDQWSARGVPIELPVQVYAWESYHSELNTSGGVSFPSVRLCQSLGLSYRPGQLELCDDIGVASLYRKLDTEDISLRGQVAYLRADLLQRYLDETDQSLVWLMWGERDQHYRGRSSNGDELHHLYADHKHIHKRSVVWTNKTKVSVGPLTIPAPAKRKPRAKLKPS